MDSEDEELGEPETFQASAARIERPQKKDDKWKNPTKILKRPEPQKERKLAVPRAMRSGEWKPAIVTEDMEVDDEKEEEAVLVRVEDNPEKKKRTPRARKKKYLDVIKESVDPEAIFDEVMKQPVTIKLQDLLACSPTFAKLLFKGATIPREEISMPSTEVGSIRLY